MADRLDTLGRALSKARAEYDDAYKKRARAEEAKKHAETDLFEFMQSNGLSKVTVDLGEPFGNVEFRQRETIRGRIFDEDEALDSFEQEARLDELTKPGFRQKALNDLVRERLETGQALPRGVDFTRQPGITVTRRT